MSVKDGCVECVNFEMRSESLGLEHDDPRVFVQSQWPCKQKLYMMYRLIVAAGFIAWLAVDVTFETKVFFKEHAYTYLIYATNWSFLLLTLTALYTAACTLFYSIKSGGSLDQQTFERMPRALKVQWFLQNVSYNAALVVTISYWSYIIILEKSSVLQTPSSRIKHTLNTTYVIVDIIISGAPIRILHLLYAVLLGTIYSVFNAFYFLNDGTILEGRHYAYNLLDWGKPSEAIVTCVFCVVLCIFAQLILYEVFRIRVWVYSRIYFGQDLPAKTDAEMQRIMGEFEAPAYQTIEDRDAGETQQKNYAGSLS